MAEKKKKYITAKIEVSKYIDDMIYLSKLRDYDYESRVMKIEYMPGSRENERKRTYMIIDGYHIIFDKVLFEKEVMKYMEDQGYMITKKKNEKENS